MNARLDAGHSAYLRARLAGSDLADVGARVLAGERLRFEDGQRLFATRDLPLVGLLANVVRERLHGDLAYLDPATLEGDRLHAFLGDAQARCARIAQLLQQQYSLQ